MKITLTHKNTTRFNISLEEAIQLVLYSLKNAKGGEILYQSLLVID